MSPPGTNADLAARIRAFEHRLARASATSIVDVPGGFAVLNADFPDSHAHNTFVVSNWVAPETLIAAADRVFGAAGLGYRQVDVDEGELAVQLAEPLTEAGWDHQPQVVMAIPDLRRVIERPATPAVLSVSVDTLRPAQSASWRAELVNAPEETVRQLVERVSATAASCDLTLLAVRAGGEVAAWCELRIIDDVAQVENVMTRPEHQGNGYARQLVLESVAQARKAGIDLVFLRALEHDWPRHWYARLGFRPAGRAAGFHRTAGVIGQEAPRNPA